ncbi:acetylcholine receptor subunit alpha-L1-like isoform X2 [Haematobia irritans]|uniref:acetylcholine receptor subunit alpha-L1-like isoform X2 n=1 Tax=Haematobia irritans TaxID=7368 RepID=UPI003F4FC27B
MKFGLHIIVTMIISISYPIAAENKSSVMSTDEARDHLMKTLLTNYHPSSKPGSKNETLMVFVDIELQHFDYREKDGAFALIGMLYAKWRDPKLVWDPLQYGNMSHISVAQRYIWVPDLEIYNNAPNKYMRMHRNGFVTVKNNGVALWSDTIEANIYCTTDMRNWPHDKHECKLTLGSWTFDGFELDIMHINANESLSFAATKNLNMQYKVTEYIATHEKTFYACCPEPYVSMSYNITFERESSFVVIFRIPAMSVIVFTLLGLNLDPRRSESFWLNSINLWMLTGQLLYFACNSYRFPKETPNIVIFYSTSFILVTISQLVAVFSKYATFSPFLFKYPLPYPIEWILGSTLALRLVPMDWKETTVKCGARHSKLTSLDEMDDSSHLIEQRYQPAHDWARFARLLQRLTFFLMSFIFLILSTVCLI